MSNADSLQVMGNDAQKWAQGCAKIIYTHYTSDPEFDLEDLLLGWFANAMCAERDFLTAKQAIDIAIGRIHFYEVTGGSYVEDGVEHRIIDPAYQELDLARARLEEGQMWFTRALAKRQGKFNPADLEASDE